MFRLLPVLALALLAAVPTSAQNADWFCISGDCRNGTGQARSLNAIERILYAGPFEGGQPQGRGVLTHENGDRYEGDVRAGKPHGRGTFSASNGDRYEGDYRDGFREGYGVITTASGARYEGDVVNGVMHGHGTFYNPENGFTYEGSWVNGTLEGIHTTRHPDGRVLRVRFERGEPVEIIE